MTFVLFLGSINQSISLDTGMPVDAAKKAIALSCWNLLTIVLTKNMFCANKSSLFQADGTETSLGSERKIDYSFSSRSRNCNFFHSRASALSYWLKKSCISILEIMYVYWSSEQGEQRWKIYVSSQHNDKETREEEEEEENTHTHKCSSDLLSSVLISNDAQ